MNSPTFIAVIPRCVAERYAMIAQPKSTGLEPGPMARHIPGMNERRPPELEMTVNGEFVSPPSAPIASRIFMWAIVIAVLAGALSLAAFALWIALIILPVAFVAAVVAWGMFRFRVWQAQRSMGGQRGVWRP
jgi:hypothetical protein